VSELSESVTWLRACFASFFSFFFACTYHIRSASLDSHALQIWMLVGLGGFGHEKKGGGILLALFEDIVGFSAASNLFLHIISVMLGFQDKRTTS
jgi:hypothetical protein